MTDKTDPRYTQDGVPHDEGKRDPRYPELPVGPEFDTPEQEIEHLRKQVAYLLSDLELARVDAKHFRAEAEGYARAFHELRLRPAVRLLEALRDLYARLRKMVRELVGVRD